MLTRASRLLIGNAAAAVDLAATYVAKRGTRSQRRASPAERLGHRERLELLADVRQRYDELGGGFFQEPPPARVSLSVVREERDAEVLDLGWRSAYEPVLPELRERYLKYPENHLAGARLFRAAARRPVAVLIHGYLGGVYAAEQRIFPVEWLRQRGLDVALFTLPFHGLRAVTGRRVPPFPSADPRFSNEGFGQAISDLRQLIDWLRAEGHPAVGVMGMSLGGYTTALAATVLEQLAFAVPIIPLASLASFAAEQGRLGASEADRAEQLEALEAVHQVVSPLHRPLLVPRERVLIVAAENDRITPVTHARRLAKHFHVPLETWPGGHLLQYGRGEKFRRIGRLLEELGVAAGDGR